jgi:nicotinate-nucleotide--dimethylbenzimidazole phosphoribosyltransferase
MRVERPQRFPVPPELGLLGEALTWLAGTQGSWPPRVPHRVRAVDVREGAGIAAGRAAADALADAGVDLVVVEASGDVTAATVVICALLDLEPVSALGTSTSVGWARQVVAVRDGLRAARAHVGDPERLATDPVLGQLVGLLAQSAVRRTAVVLAGSPVIAAGALVADRLEPGARHWWLQGTSATSPAARAAFADAGLAPLLELGLSIPGGAALAADLLIGGIDLASRLHDPATKRV